MCGVSVSWDGEPVVEVLDGFAGCFVAGGGEAAVEVGEAAVEADGFHALGVVDHGGDGVGGAFGVTGVDVDEGEGGQAVDAAADVAGFGDGLFGGFGGVAEIAESEVGLGEFGQDHSGLDVAGFGEVAGGAEVGGGLFGQCHGSVGFAEHMAVIRRSHEEWCFEGTEEPTPDNQEEREYYLQRLNPERLVDLLPDPIPKPGDVRKESSRMWGPERSVLLVPATAGYELPALIPGCLYTTTGTADPRTRRSPASTRS